MAYIHKWTEQLHYTGALSADLDITPTSEMSMSELVLSSATATASATLTIYKDSKTAGNKVFDGKWGNRDFEGSIKFPIHAVCTAKFIVVTTGSGAYYALMRYR